MGALTVISRQTPEQLIGWPSFLQAPISWLLGSSWWLVVALGALAAIGKVIKEKLDTNWVWATVKSIVDQIRKDAFAGQLQPAPTDHHRATLFRYQKFLWWPFPARGLWPWGRGRGPSSGWLVPVIRSGTRTQKSVTYFLAPDRGEDAEGVAGAVWAQEGELDQSPGFTLGENGVRPTDVQITDYAKKASLSETSVRRMLSQGKVLSASFRGVVVLGKESKIWGVLMLDSRTPDGAAKANLNIAHYAYCLGKLLERT
jgi:hypothetical protein